MGKVRVAAAGVLLVVRVLDQPAPERGGRRADDRRGAVPVLADRDLGDRDRRAGSVPARQPHGERFVGGVVDRLFWDVDRHRVGAGEVVPLRFIVVVQLVRRRAGGGRAEPRQIDAGVLGVGVVFGRVRGQHLEFDRWLAHPVDAHDERQRAALGHFITGPIKPVSDPGPDELALV